MNEPKDPERPDSNATSTGGIECYDVPGELIHKHPVKLILEDNLNQLQKFGHHILQCEFDGLTIGLVIVKLTRHPTVLLLKRAPHSSVYPGVFEIPTCHISHQDSTVWSGVRRELKARTGLSLNSMDNVKKTLGGLRYDSKQSWTNHVGEPSNFKRIIHINFIVVLDETSKLRLDAREHTDYAWVEEKDMAKKKMGQKMRNAVGDALRWAEKENQNNKKTSYGPFRWFISS